MADSYKELLGYKLMLAFEGMTPPPHVEEWLSTRSIAGFTFFRAFNVQNPAQLRELTDALQRIAKQSGRPRLLIAADQEGGQFIGLGDQPTQFPGNMALAAARNPDLTREVGIAIGRELAAMGVNINYAPVCDVNTNPSNPGLGIRSFGDDPALVASMAAAMVEGLQAAGIASTLKHFPGAGDGSVDSHFGLPILNHNRERLDQTEFVPFRAGIEAGTKLIMTGHFAIPALTGTTEVPATIARAVMHDLLRDQWGFEGVTITDALDMGAITQGAGQIIEVIAAVRAGVDLMLLTRDPEVYERLDEGLKLAYSRGLIDASHVDQSVQRILELKEWVSQQPQPDLDVVGCAEHQKLARRVGEQALTLVRNDEGLIPLHLDTNARIAAIMPQPIDLTPADTSSYVKPGLAAALRAYHSHVDEFITSQSPTESEIAALKERAAEYDLLVIGTISASMQPEQATLVKELLALNIPTVTLALRTPYDIAAYPESHTHICTYSIQETALSALAAGLWGDIPFSSKLPVQIAGLYPLGHGLQQPAVRTHQAS